ncbi:hypothetical protein ACTXT7_001744 [Hymenolepis weldensis]
MSRYSSPDSHPDPYLQLLSGNSISQLLSTFSFSKSAPTASALHQVPRMVEKHLPIKISRILNMQGRTKLAAHYEIRKAIVRV